jgi:hypothetical protein
MKKRISLISSLELLEAEWVEVMEEDPLERQRKMRRREERSEEGLEDNRLGSEEDVLLEEEKE